MKRKTLNTTLCFLEAQEAKKQMISKENIGLIELILKHFDGLYNLPKHNLHILAW